MKKIISTLLVFLIILLNSTFCFANVPILNSKRYVIYDRASGQCIYGKDEKKQTAMASTTKIMSAIIVLEKTNNLNEEITISKKAASMGGSTLRIKRK